MFSSVRDYQRFISTIGYYLYIEIPLRYSYFIRLQADERRRILRYASERTKWVTLLAYCLMPNHVHLLIKQEVDDGITRFIARSFNSFTKYYNIKQKRKGTMLEGRFRAVHIDTDEQLLHVSRYIHLNPYSGYLVPDINRCLSYRFSSIAAYCSEATEAIADPGIVLSHFRNREEYRTFVSEQADYQRDLQQIKHLILE